MNETYKQIPNTRYYVSNMGNIKSEDSEQHVFLFGAMRTIYHKGKILTPRKTEGGYLHVCLYIDGTKQDKAIHRLVAEAFVPNPKNKPHINHIDGDKTNNMATNLDWVTPKENTRHWIDVLGIKKRYGELGRKTKIVVQKDKNGNVLCTYNGLGEASRKNKYSLTCIQQCCAGKIQTAYGYVWEYKTNK